tara:strand:- start:9554 stop:10138 length:585 start_codon:yes stop_codon:yes gene_type:complete
MSIVEKLSNISEYLSSSKKVMGKSVIDVEKIKEMLEEVQENLPRELEQSEVIISQKESILNDASEEAEKLTAETSQHCENLIAEAQSRADEIVSKDEIVAEAQSRADEIVSQAEKTKEDTMEVVEHNKNEIMSRASSMQEESENYSSQRRKDADQYAKEVLFSLEERLSLSLAQIRKGLETMESANKASEEKVA